MVSFGPSASWATPPDAWTPEEEAACRKAIRGQEKEYERGRGRWSRARPRVAANVAGQVLALKAAHRAISAEDRSRMKEILQKMRGEGEAARYRSLESLGQILGKGLKAVDPRFPGWQCPSDRAFNRGKPGRIGRYEAFGPSSAVPAGAAPGAPPIDYENLASYHVANRMLEFRCDSPPRSRDAVLLVDTYARAPLSRDVSYVFDGRTIRFVAASYENRDELSLPTAATVDALSEDGEIEGESVEASLDHRFARRDVLSDDRLIRLGKKPEFIQLLDERGANPDLKCGTYYLRRQNLAHPAAGSRDVSIHQVPEKGVPAGSGEAPSAESARSSGNAL